MHDHIQRIRNDEAIKEQERNLLVNQRITHGKDLRVQIQQKEYLAALDRQINKIPSVKMSGVYGQSETELLQSRIEKMKETTQDLTIQMKLKTFMEAEASKN